jgi:hypothetical protein
LPKLTNAECRNCVPRTCTAACVDEVSCRMFLCARCRCQVLVCLRCDRGQIYCTGTCGQEARRDKQREARRRYQTTPRGRAMHAERSRRYRARVGRVTDHGCVMEHETGLLRGLEVSEPLREPSSGRKAPGHTRCHHCGRFASSFLRLSALRPERRLGKKSQIIRGDSRFGRPP